MGLDDFCLISSNIFSELFTLLSGEKMLLIPATDRHGPGPGE